MVQLAKKTKTPESKKMGKKSATPVKADAAALKANLKKNKSQVKTEAKSPKQLKTKAEPQSPKQQKVKEIQSKKQQKKKQAKKEETAKNNVESPKKRKREDDDNQTKSTKKFAQDPEMTVFVGRLNAETTAATIQAHFEKYGEVENVKIPSKSEGGPNMRFCFVTFKQRNTLGKVMSQKHKIDGRDVFIEKKKGPVVRKEIFSRENEVMARFDSAVTKDEFTEYFKGFGEVNNISFPMRRVKGEHVSKGFAFVAYEDKQSMDKVLKKQHKINEYSLKVKASGKLEGNVIRAYFHESTTEEDMEKYAKQFGKIKDITVFKKDAHAIINYENNDSIEKILKKKHSIKKHSLYFQQDRQGIKMRPNEVKLFNLQYEANRYDIFNALSKFGKVTEVITPKHKSNGKGGRFAFVVFEEEGACTKAVEAGTIDIAGRDAKIICNDEKSKQKHDAKKAETVTMEVEDSDEEEEVDEEQDSDDEMEGDEEEGDEEEDDEEGDSDEEMEEAEDDDDDNEEEEDDDDEEEEEEDDDDDDEEEE